MAILVDDLTHYAKSPLGPRAWCHMVSDTSLSELHAFAARLGLKRAWFQNHQRVPHYDLVASMRVKALAAGAVAVTGQDLVRRATRPATITTPPQPASPPNTKWS